MFSMGGFIPGVNDFGTRFSQAGMKAGTILHEANNPTPGMEPGVMIRNLARIPSRMPVWSFYQNMRKDATGAFNALEASRVTAETQAKRSREQDRRGAGLSGNIGGARRGNVLIGLLGLMGDAQTAKRTLGGAQ